MAHKLVEYSHGKVNSALGLPHLWGKVFPLIPLDVLQEEFVASKPEFAIISKNINQMRRDLANSDGAEEDVPERNVRPRTDVGSSSQAPRETGESSQSQPNLMQILLKSFEALQARVDEGFPKITDLIDSINISLISQAEEMRMLRDSSLSWWVRSLRLPSPQQRLRQRLRLLLRLLLLIHRGLVRLQGPMVLRLRMVRR
ncbi:hypothetical protein PIB30_029473 [Stylosanthes scabra]|uniref:Uncharacterized protein n=1 Tax=Stylosanthes scabra TaxID=79078 RepID=A0ABU6QAS9_9FABA|nr:hypothetical protein [Stylosanthes scabra]